MGTTSALHHSRDGDRRELLAAGEGDGGGKSWLQPTELNGSFALMCMPCHHVLPTGSAADVQICNLLGHHKSDRHVAAVRTFNGTAIGPLGRPTAGAPSAQDFAKAWDMACKGTAPSQGLEDVGQKHKLRRMQYCVFEALSTLDRAFLATATIGLSRDERHFRLLIRYSACSADLEVRKGVLWQVQRCQATGEKITEETSDALKKFATPIHGAPSKSNGDAISAKETDFKLVKHVVKATEVMKVDSASNEILSCQLMQQEGAITIGEEKACFKNMIIARDKAHGSRRRITSAAADAAAAAG